MARSITTKLFTLQFTDFKYSLNSTVKLQFRTYQNYKQSSFLSLSSLQLLLNNHKQYYHHNSNNINNNNNNHKSHKNNWKYFNGKYIAVATVATILGATCGIYSLYDNQNKVYASANAYEQYHKTVRSDLPTYTTEDVLKHDKKETGIWVTYGIGVYDITKFVPQHPGASGNILMAAGNAIDPFWNIYQQHNTKQILTLLETFRIGNLDVTDTETTKDLFDPWSNEPKRHVILKPVTLKPFNAEPPISLLAESFLTPTEIFYVRNHLPVPVIDIDEYELEISIEDTDKKLCFNYKDLIKLPKQNITATIMCGGNRRSEMHKVKPVKGLNWGAAVVGNAIWSGPKLCDILKKMGIESDETSHVHFEGLDMDPTATPYAASIPLSKALDPRSDVILACEMNGKPLTRDHGYPIRVIVPGVVGARNVKWLGRIIISKNESMSHWQQNDYKGFSPSTDWDTVDFSKSPAIQNMPVTSAICIPQADERIKLSKMKKRLVNIKGYAWSGGGAQIVRVDLSIDKGKTWFIANLEPELNTKPTGRHWAWTLWSKTIEIPQNTKEIEIWSKAVDANYNVQPETFENTWNLRGVLCNAYHKIKIYFV